jgi:hypothetical protein
LPINHVHPGVLASHVGSLAPVLLFAAGMPCRQSRNRTACGAFVTPHAVLKHYAAKWIGAPQVAEPMTE